MSDDARRDWASLDEQLDRAIDALNDEQSPEQTDDVELALLIDAARLARQLREPETWAAPDAAFPARLLEVVANGPALIQPNGHVASELVPVRIPRRRGRLLLAQLAAVIRAVGVCVLAGIVAGALIGGVGGRVAMRVSGAMYERAHPDVPAITSSSDEPVGQLSLDGTLSLIFEAGLFFGIAGGLAYLLVRPWLPRRVPARGLVFAAMLLALGSVVIDKDNPDFRRFGSPVVNITMFVGLIVAYGWCVAFLAEWFDRRPRRWRTIPLRVLTYGAGMLGLLGLMSVGALGLVTVIGVFDASGWAAAVSLVTGVALLLLPVLRVLVVLPAGSGPRRQPAADAWRAGLVLLVVVGGLGLAVTLHAIVTILGG